MIDWTPGLYALAIVSVPFSLYSLACLINALTLRTQIMPMIAAFQPVLDELNALPAEIAAKVAASAGVLPEGAASAQDVTDTVAALQAAADTAKAATA